MIMQHVTARRGGGRPLHPGNNESLFMSLGRLRELEEGVKPCNVGVRSAITAWHAVGKQRSNAITLLSISSLCRSGRPSLALPTPCTPQASVNYSSSLLCEVLLRHSARLQLLHNVQKPCATSIRKKAFTNRFWCVVCFMCVMSTRQTGTRPLQDQT